MYNFQNKNLRIEMIINSYREVINFDIVPEVPFTLINISSKMRFSQTFLKIRKCVRHRIDGESTRERDI